MLRSRRPSRLIMQDTEIKFRAHEATNPCGEQPLYPNEACNLGSLNLMAFAAQSQGVWDLDWVWAASAVFLGHTLRACFSALGGQGEKSSTPRLFPL